VGRGRGGGTARSPFDARRAIGYDRRDAVSAVSAIGDANKLEYDVMQWV
jgi:hypothetical protein